MMHPGTLYLSPSSLQNASDRFASQQRTSESHSQWYFSSAYQPRPCPREFDHLRRASFSAHNTALCNESSPNVENTSHGDTSQDVLRQCDCSALQENATIPGGLAEIVTLPDITEFNDFVIRCFRWLFCRTSKKINTFDSWSTNETRTMMNAELRCLLFRSYFTKINTIHRRDVESWY